MEVVQKLMTIWKLKKKIMTMRVLCQKLYEEHFLLDFLAKSTLLRKTFYQQRWEILWLNQPLSLQIVRVMSRNKVHPMHM